MSYLCVSLTVNGKAKNYNVHRLVADAFLGPPPSPAHQAAHIDGDGFNNRLRNLKWATQKENERDKLSHGTRVRGSQVRGSKLTESDVLDIRTDPASQTQIAKRYGIAQTTVSKIKRHIRWQWLA
jgi:hypothetical protein